MKKSNTSSPQEKQIEPLLPELIKILEEGGAVERMGRFLVSQGWTYQDAWREVKKISASTVCTGALTYAVKDLAEHGQMSGIEHEWADSLRFDLKRVKKYGKLEPQR